MGKALSLALAASLVTTLNVPMAALADETADPAAQPIERQEAAGTEFAATEDSAAQPVDQQETAEGQASAADALAADVATEAVTATEAAPAAVMLLQAPGANGDGEKAQPVATIGTATYSSLDDALVAAKDGETVKVIANATMSATGRVDGKSITLDLGGCAVGVDNRAFNVVNGGKLTLDDTMGGGTLAVSKVGSTLSLGVVTGAGGSFVMKGGTLQAPEYGVYITAGCNGDLVSMQGGTIKADYGICAIGNGDAGSARVEISGGSVEGNIFGFATNGSIGNGGVDLVMTGGSVITTSQADPAMYLPALNSTATITGGTVKGATGIEIRAGELSISGDAKIMGEGSLVIGSNAGGPATSGVAVAVTQHTTKQPIAVTISGSPTLEGVYGLYECNPQNNDETAIKQVKLSVEGGTFQSTGTENAQAVYSKDCTGFVKGGTFNTEFPTSLVADGSALLVDEEGLVTAVDEASAIKDAGAFVEKDGKKVYYTTQKAAENANGSTGAIEVFVVEAGGKKYTSVADALAAAQGSVELVLLADVAESVTIPAGMSVSLDLAGHVLTGSDNGQGGIGDVVTNRGTLVVKDSSADGSGVVLGGSDAGSGTAGRTGIALVNEGTCTIEGGTVKRGDDGTFGNYTVYNKESGSMTIAGGVVTNNSNTSSLVRNDGDMLVSGGEISQKSFNALKNDVGKLTITGGVISSDDQALQNWSEATIKGGTFNGAVYTWSCAGAPDGYRFATVIEGGTINGTVAAVNYDGSDAVAQVTISGPAKINGDVAAYDYNGGSFDPADNGDGLLIEISDGVFSGSVDDSYIVPGSGLRPDENGNLVAVEAKLVADAGKVVDGVYIYDVAGVKAVTEADLLSLVGMNVDPEKSGYTISVDTANLSALNKAIAAKDTAAAFAFRYEAVKNGVQTLAADDEVEPLTITVKLTDSSATGGSGTGNSGGSAGEPGGSKAPADKVALAATGDDTPVAVGVAGTAALAGAAMAAAGAVALSRRKQQ